MTRVSENSQSASLTFSLNKAKQKLENLQLKGASLKSMTRPSDNPLGNVESLSIDSVTKNSKQFMRNSDFAKMHLTVTEKALDQLTEILVKAKEIAITQSSDFYGKDIRKNVANEVVQLRNQAVSIGNKRLGQKYIFSGYKTLTRPFNDSGEYAGDKGHTTVEIAKDFFIPLNLNGEEVFFSTSNSATTKDEHPLEKFPEMNSSPIKKNEEGEPILEAKRDLASVEIDKFQKRENIFSILSSLTAALENDDPDVIQNLLEGFDDSISRLITLRTKVGSISNSIDTSYNANDSDNIARADRKSKLMDADIAELFADIAKQQSVLQTTYKSTQGLISKQLLDFLR